MGLKKLYFINTKKNFEKNKLEKNAYAYVALQWVQILSKVAFSFFQENFTIFFGNQLYSWGQLWSLEECLGTEYY